MKLDLTPAEKEALFAYLADSPDCEQLSAGEWVADLYEIDAPASLYLTTKKGNVFADGAEYLAYDERMGGWHLSGAVESARRVVELLRLSGALGT